MNIVVPPLSENPLKEYICSLLLSKIGIDVQVIGFMVQVKGEGVAVRLASFIRSLLFSPNPASRPSLFTDSTQLQHADDDATDSTKSNLVGKVLALCVSYRISYVAASGYLINNPGSKSQKWHEDGPGCFVPSIDLNEE